MLAKLLPLAPLSPSYGLVQGAQVAGGLRQGRTCPTPPHASTGTTSGRGAGGGAGPLNILSDQLTVLVAAQAQGTKHHWPGSRNPALAVAVGVEQALVG
jgi:hypothetical protein